MNKAIYARDLCECGAASLYTPKGTVYIIDTANKLPRQWEGICGQCKKTLPAEGMTPVWTINQKTGKTGYLPVGLFEIDEGECPECELLKIGQGATDGL